MSTRDRCTTVAVPLSGGGTATVVVRAAGPLTARAAAQLTDMLSAMIRSLGDVEVDPLPASYVDTVRQLSAATDEAMRVLLLNQEPETVAALRTASNAARSALRRLIEELRERTTQMIANDQAAEDAQDDRLLAVVDRYAARLQAECDALNVAMRVPAELVTDLLAELRGLAGVSADGQVSL